MSFDLPCTVFFPDGALNSIQGETWELLHAVMNAVLNGHVGIRKDLDAMKAKLQSSDDGRDLAHYAMWHFLRSLATSHLIETMRKQQSGAVGMSFCCVECACLSFPIRFVSRSGSEGGGEGRRGCSAK